MRPSFSPLQGVCTSPLRVIALAICSLLLMSGFAWAAPTAPSNLTVFLDRTSANKADPNYDTYVFFWNDNSTDETSFVITYNNGNSFATVPSSTTSTTGNVGVSYKITTTLAIGTTIQWQVAAVNASGTSSASPVTSASTTTVQTAQMVTPTSVSVTANSETAITVTWTDSSTSADGDELWLSANGGTYTYLGDVYFYQTKSISVPGLSPGTPYQVKVRAYQDPATTGGARTYSSYSNPSSSVNTKDGFTSRAYQPITYNQAFSYQATVSTASSRTSWSITGLPTGLTFNSSTGVVSGTPTVTGVYSCPMTATFSSGWTTNSTLTLRIIRAAAAPVTGTTISSQTLASGGNTSVSLTDKFSDPDSESAVRLSTNMGTMDFILYNTATPATVTNFLSYVNNPNNSGNYNGAVFHRSVPGFVIQGGGFKVQSAPNNFTSITTTASPTNEPGISNLTGTVAMAKLGTDPNSATDQFFVNLADNSSNLDNQNGGFTVFARVAGSGMTTANAIAALPTVNSTVNVDGNANTSLTNWPVTSGSTMDTTKMVTITSAAPVAVLSYSITGNTNSSAVSASISGTNLQINGVAGGQSNVTVTATDLDGNTVSQTFAVTVNQAPTITSAAPAANGAVGSAYSFTYTATGYPAPTFSVTSGALPAGLSLSPAGVIFGTCTTAGTYSGVVTATNSNGTNTQNFSITVPKLSGTITLGSLSQTYDGTAKTVTSTTTPSGLTVTYTYNGSSTAPTNAGSYPVVATINDTNYQGTANGTLNVAQASASIALSGLTQVYDGTAKSVTATTTPAGLTVNITYNGSSTAPSDFGSYTVAASISDTNYTGTQGGTLVIQGQSASTWKSLHFTSGQISAGLSADDADPDGDGVKNLAEYAMGTDPLTRNTPPQPTVDANGLTLIFTRPKALPDVTYSAESTDSFGSWSPVTLEVISDGPVQTVRARDTLSSGNTTRRFMHLIFGTP